MTPRTTPDDPEGESGVLLSPAPETNPPLAILTRPWFWVLFVGAFWSIPLFKSIGAEWPEPLAGFERSPEVRQYVLADGRGVSLAELRNQLVIASVLDLSTPESSRRTFEAFRENRSRVRGLSSLVIQLVLVQGADLEGLELFLEEKTARRPNNLYVLDAEGDELLALRRMADSPTATTFLFDRHARLRGFYGGSEAELDRFARETGILANWIGSDPEPGEPIAY